MGRGGRSRSRPRPRPRPGSSGASPKPMQVDNPNHPGYAEYIASRNRYNNCTSKAGFFNFGGVSRCLGQYAKDIGAIKNRKYNEGFGMTECISDNVFLILVILIVIALIYYQTQTSR